MLFFPRLNFVEECQSKIIRFHGFNHIIDALPWAYWNISYNYLFHLSKFYFKCGFWMTQSLIRTKHILYLYSKRPAINYYVFIYLSTAFIRRYTDFQVACAVSEWLNFANYCPSCMFSCWQRFYFELIWFLSIRLYFQVLWNLQVEFHVLK